MVHSFGLQTGIGRACWASYLINGDASGISRAEQEKADAFAAYMGGDIVDCDDESQFAIPEHPPGQLAGQCVEFRALVR